MKKIDIKKMLKEEASKKDIPDLTQQIINKVDTSKVKLAPVKEKNRPFNYRPILFSGIASLLLVATLLVSVSLMLNVKNSNTLIPDDSTSTVSTDNTTNKDSTSTTTEVISTTDEINIEDYLDENLLLMLNKIEAQEAYNIINVANTFNSVSFTNYEVAFDTLTVELEESMVDDINTYINNIDEMFLLSNQSECLESANDNYNYDFTNKIEVKNDYIDYCIYYSEVVVKLNNDINNYKLKSDINGLIVCGENEYQFVGVKRIKNDTLSYDTTITIKDDSYVKVSETFKEGLNEFKYEYHYGENTKDVSIKQTYYTGTLETKSVEFIANSNKYNELKITLTKNDDYLSGKIKGRNCILVIAKDELNHIYTFNHNKGKDGSTSYER